MEGGCNAVASTLGVLGSVGRRYLGLDSLSVQVLALESDLPVEEDTPIRIEASAETFPGSDGMPEAAERTETTDDTGVASFPINPPAPAPAATIALTASVTIGGEEYECVGEIQTRIDHVFVPFLGLADQAVSEIERPETAADRTAQAGQYDDSERLAAEAQSPRRPPEPRDRHQPAGQRSRDDVPPRRHMIECNQRRRCRRDPWRDVIAAAPHAYQHRRKQRRHDHVQFVPAWIA